MNIIKLPTMSLVAATLLAIAGCQAVTAESDLPALIIQPNEASRAALQVTLSKLFGGQIVKLSDEALTRSSLLTLEPGLQNINNSKVASGRVLSGPYKFRLVQNRDACILIDMRDGSRHALANTTCVTE